MITFLGYISLILLMLSCNESETKKNVHEQDVIPSELTYKVLGKSPHDTLAFTEGFFVTKGQLFESTGGQPKISDFKSWFGPVDSKTGKFIKRLCLIQVISAKE